MWGGGAGRWGQRLPCRAEGRGAVQAVRREAGVCACLPARPPPRTQSKCSMLAAACPSGRCRTNRRSAADPLFTHIVGNGSSSSSSSALWCRPCVMQGLALSQLPHPGVLRRPGFPPTSHALKTTRRVYRWCKHACMHVVCCPCHACAQAALNSDEEDEEDKAKQRRWDDYSDANPRGAGNSKIRPCG